MEFKNCTTSHEKNTIKRLKSHHTNSEELQNVITERRNVDGISQLVDCLNRTNPKNGANILDDFGALLPITVKLGDDTDDDDYIISELIASAHLSEDNDFSDVLMLIDRAQLWCDSLNACLSADDFEIVSIRPCSENFGFVAFVWCRTEDGLTEIWKVVLSGEFYSILKNFIFSCCLRNIYFSIILELSDYSLAAEYFSGIKANSLNFLQVGYGMLINTLPIELIEMILMRTATMLTVRLVNAARRPDIDAYAMLATVCLSWYETITGRSWFRNVLHRRLKIAKVHRSKITKLPVELIELILMKTATQVSFNRWCVTSWPELDAFSTIAPVCYAWFDTITRRQWFRDTLKNRLARQCRPYLRHIERQATLNAGNSRVTGIAQLRGRVYTISEWTSTISVFSAFDPLNSRLADIMLDSLSQTLWDIVASAGDVCLYVSDGKNNCIWRVKDDTERTCSRWVDGGVEFPGTLSVTSDGTILTVSVKSRRMDVIEPDGSRQKVNLPADMEQPLHAVRSNSGTYLVCHGDKDADVYFVSEITSDGADVLRRFGGWTVQTESPGRIGKIVHLAVDHTGRLIVADSDNDRVLLVDKTMGRHRVLVGGELDGVDGANRLCFVPETRTLMVGLNAGQVHVYSIMPDEEQEWQDLQVNLDSTHQEAT